MASFYLQGPPQFPEGTSVKAYPLSNWNGADYSGAAPVGSEDATATVTAGVAAFTGLDPDTRYVAYAEVASQHRYVRFSTLTSTSDSAGSGSGIPNGGTDGQVLTKQSSTDGDAAWEAPAGAGLGSPNTQTDAYTLVLADDRTVVEINAGTAKALTVPPNSSVAFPVGAQITARQMGAGQVTLTAGAGVTIRSRGSALKLAGQYAEATVIKRAADEWVASGDLTP